MHAIPAEGGYYCLLDTRATGLRATEFAARLLTEERVAVTPMQGWGSDYLVRLIFTHEPEDGGARPAAGSPASPRPR